MTSKWKIIIPVGVIAAIALWVGYSQLKTKAPQYTTKQAPTETQKQIVTEAVPPVASGNIDDVVSALLQDSSGETLAFQEETGDIDLIAADSQAISDFGQSYNENEF